MDILHVVPTYLPAVRYGGPIYSVHGLCKALAALGHGVEVFTTNVDGASDARVPLGERVGIEGVRVSYFAVPALRRLYWSPAMREALKRRCAEFDVVHTHSVFLWPTWAAAREARRQGVPHVVSPRGMLDRELVRRKSRWLKTAWIALIERRNVERSSAVHVTSAAEEKALAGFGFDLPRVVTVPNGVEAPDAERGDEAAEDPRTVLFLGRINWKKGLARLIEAVALVPDVELIVAGNDEEGHTQELLRLAAGRGVAARVRFAGPAYGAEKWRLYRRAACFVLASDSENFANTVLEAMAAGCPVVVTPNVGLADVVQRCGAGYVVDATPAALAAAIAEIVGDGAVRARMRACGRRVAEEQFEWKRIARRMAAVYESVRAGGAAPLAGHERRRHD